MNKQEAMKTAAIEFSQGTPIEEVMKKYNVCYASVYNAIKRFNIPYKKTYGRKYFFNESFFEKIDTEEKAYWLGQIMSDGSIQNSGASDYNRCTFCASEIDKEHLILFQKVIGHTGNLNLKNQKNSYTNKTMYHLNCDSMKMASDLIKVGCLPRKTGHSHLPKISKRLIRHFIRGYFDGDGSLSVFNYTSKSKNGKERSEVRGEFSITSDGTILSEIQEVLMKECILKKTKLKTYKRTSKAVSLRYGSKQQIQRIFDYLYKDATVYLQRKYDKFSLLLSQ